MAIVGLGKMGLSHLAILRMHPDLKLVGACDTAGYLLDVIGKYTDTPCFGDLDKMLDEARPEALLVATPSTIPCGDCAEGPGARHPCVLRKALRAGSG